MATALSRAACRLFGAGLGLLLASLAGCAAPQPVAALGPIPPGAARVWFYRDLEPSESLNYGALSMNGIAVGQSIPGGSFYRDVPPGRYHVTVASYGRDLYQAQDIALAPGQEVYLKVLSLRSWEEGRTGFSRDTFYVWLIPSETARNEIRRTNYLGGG